MKKFLAAVWLVVVAATPVSLYCVSLDVRLFFNGLLVIVVVTATCGLVFVATAESIKTLRKP